MVTLRQGLLVLCLGLVLHVPLATAADTEEAQYNVVVALYNAGQWEAALKKISEREALTTLGDGLRLRYQYARALALEKGGKVAEARAVYEALAAGNPSSLEVRKAQASLLYMDYAAKQLDGVVTRYEKLNKKELEAGEKRNLALMYAESLFGLHTNAPAAVRAYQEALALGAERQAVAVKLFDLYYQTGNSAALLELSATGVKGVSAEMVALVRAESFLAVKKAAEAEKEARKVSADSEVYPRASFVLAQALIRQNRMADAVAPLELAVKALRDPPVPPAGRLALAECLLASGRTNDAEKVLEHLVDQTRTLPEAERQKLMGEVALLQIRLASEGPDPRRLVKVIANTREFLPREKLPEVLYLKLFALSQAGEERLLLASMAEDLAVLQGSRREGAAVLLYVAALTKHSRLAEAGKALEDFLNRQPKAPEALRARLELANTYLKLEDFAKARLAFQGVAASTEVAKLLGAEAYREFLYNQAVVAVRQKEFAEAIAPLQALLQNKPEAPLRSRALQLLGQVQTARNDLRGAAESWKQLLASGKVDNEAEVRDRLARALVANKDLAGARVQFEAASQLLGGAAKLARESRELWARASFGANDFAAAAAQYRALFEAFPDAPAYAYEGAVSQERAGNWVAAEQGYASAAKQRQQLPADYAADLEASLARARLQSGGGDQGMAYWLGRLGTNATPTEFERGVAALNRIKSTTTAGEGLPRLEALLAHYPATEVRYYALGAVLLRLLAAQARQEELGRWSNKLATDLAAHESILTNKSFGTTLAPAMIYFYRGESDRLAGRAAEALASYETVLAVYPYNEWPDAAGCSAAECYAALGDSVTASNKWMDVIKSAGTAPGSAAWRERAQQNLQALAKKQ